MQCASRTPAAALSFDVAAQQVDGVHRVVVVHELLQRGFGLRGRDVELLRVPAEGHELVRGRDSALYSVTQTVLCESGFHTERGGEAVLRPCPWAGELGGR